MISAATRGALMILAFVVIITIIILPSSLKTHRVRMSKRQNYYWRKFSIFLIIICIFLLVGGCMYFFDKKNSLKNN